MNRFSITLAAATVSAFALMAAAPVGAHAEFALTPGQWLDVKHHVALGSLPDGNEYAARAEYAKLPCANGDLFRRATDARL